MKLIFELNNIKELNSLKKVSSIEYILIGLKDFSFCSPLEFSINEINYVIEQIVNKGLKVIINLERIYTNNELDELKELIKLINMKDVSYITYSDIGLNLFFKKLGMEEKLIMRSPTYLTNSNDLNIYQEYNKYVTCSSEISKEELKQIIDTVNKPIIIDVFGQNAIFHSRRKLLSTYFDYRIQANDPKKSKYSLVEEMREEPYPIREYEKYSVVYEPKHYLLDEELIELKNCDKVPYGFIHTNNLSVKDTILLAKAIDDFLNNNDISKLKESLKQTKIEYYKGAYDMSSFLLKKEAKANE